MFDNIKQCFIVVLILNICIHVTLMILSIFSNTLFPSNYRFMMNLKLFIVMGVSWIVELIPSIIQNIPKVYEYSVDFINLLQGVLVFIIFVCKRKVLIAFQKRLGKIRRHFYFVCETKSYDFPIGIQGKFKGFGMGTSSSNNTHATSLDYSVRSNGNQIKKVESTSTISAINMNVLKS